MKTENDIHAFMQENKLTLGDGDKFMSDLVRQIDLLPVPAALDDAAERRRQEELEALTAWFAAMKRGKVRKLVVFVAVSCVICLAAFAILPLFSMSWLQNAATSGMEIAERFSAFLQPVSSPIYICVCLSIGFAVIASASAAGARIFYFGGRN